MTLPLDSRPHQLVRTVAVAIVCLGCASIAVPPASAGEYYVGACDAATGGAHHAWGAQAGSFNTYKLCPTPGGGSPNPRGMVTRLTGRTFGSGEFSRLWFYAPGGTQIARVDWSGRMARDACSWHIELRADGGFGVASLLKWAGGPGQASCTTSHENPNIISFWPPGGTTAVMQNVQCQAATCPSGATFHTYYAGVVLHDYAGPAISMGGINEGEWVRRDRTVSFSAVDNIGIKLVKLFIDGKEQPGAIGYGCDYASTVPCANHDGAFNIPTIQLSSGSHRIEILAFDGSDTPVVIARNVRVDNTPPAQVALKVSGGDGWRRANDYALTWPSVADHGSPIVGGTWELCKAGRISCSSGQLTQPNPTALASVRLPADGAYELRVVLRDQAGNVAALSDARPAMLRLDRDPPPLNIAAFDSSTPLAITASAGDSLSGLVSGQLRMRREGTEQWTDLRTEVAPGARELVAFIDDERHTKGRYELHAHAVDHAGNEASTSAEPNGRKALRDLPIRAVTRIGAGKKVTLRRARGKRKRQRFRVRYDTDFSLARRRNTVLVGTLATATGSPVRNSRLRVLTRPELPGAGFSDAGRVETDNDGRFAFKVRGTVSRTLRFRYDGTDHIRPSTADVNVRVPAASTFRLLPRRILNGETVTFRGRVLGGPIPPGGKLVELRRWTGRRWDPFRVVRTGPDGRWSHTEPVVSVSGLVVFRLRAHIPVEAGFPYAAGRTTARNLRVKGL